MFLYRPYSPDLNPIEIAFGTAKKWLQNHQDICEKYPKRCFEIALYQVKLHYLLKFI
jgi:transposase